jgi:hypothetical protein
MRDAFSAYAEPLRIFEAIRVGDPPERLKRPPLSARLG